MLVSRLTLLRMRNISDKSCRETQNTHLCSVIYSDNHAVYEIKWENMVEPDGPPDENIIQCMRLVWWIAKATKKNTNTHTHTLRIYKSYCFYTVTVITRTDLSITLSCIAPLVDSCEITSMLRNVTQGLGHWLIFGRLLSPAICLLG